MLQKYIQDTSIVGTYKGPFSIIPGTPLEDVRKIFRELLNKEVILELHSIFPDGHSWSTLNGRMKESRDGSYSIKSTHGVYQKRDLEVTSLKNLNPRGKHIGSNFHHAEIWFPEFNRPNPFC